MLYRFNMTESSTADGLIQTAFWVVFLGYQHLSVSSVNISDQALSVQRLQRKDINHSHMNVFIKQNLTLGSQFLSGFQGFMHEDSAGDNTY
jgi:hypothetical protein